MGNTVALTDGSAYRNSIDDLLADVKSIFDDLSELLRHRKNRQASNVWADIHFFCLFAIK